MKVLLMRLGGIKLGFDDHTTTVLSAPALLCHPFIISTSILA